VRDAAVIFCQHFGLFVLDWLYRFLQSQVLSSVKLKLMLCSCNSFDLSTHVIKFVCDKMLYASTSVYY
jgi:hypothetical protein